VHDLRADPARHSGRPLPHDPVYKVLVEGDEVFVEK